MNEQELYYRLQDRIVYDESKITVDTLVFRVVKRTPKGAWIVKIGECYSSDLDFTHYHSHGKKRFVLDGPGKRHAYPSMEAAIESYLARKEMQIWRLESQLKQARAAFEWGKHPDFKPGIPRYDKTLSGFHSY